MNISTINKPLHGSQEWLQVRWKNENNQARISASVAAVVHGEHQYKSIADLAMELLNDNPPTPTKTNEAMERGNRLEPTLVAWVADLLGVEVKTPDIMYTYDAPGLRLIATLDGVTSNNVPVEVKTTRKIWGGALNREWYWQGVHQAICVGADSVEWGILDGNLEFHRYTQVVSSDEKGIHLDACTQFLAAIDNGFMPDNAVLNYSHIETMYPVQEAKVVELTADQGLLVNDLAEIRDAKRALDTQEDAIKALLGAVLQNSDTGVLNGKTLVTWKTQSRTSFDSKKFELDHPVLAGKYKKQTEYKTMKTTKGAK
jgi:predicted phage-related endonuclease